MRRAVLTIGITVAGAAAITACSTTSGASVGAADSAAVAVSAPAAFANVKAPADAINVSSLKGKTVYWIPITTQAALFGIEQSAVTSALRSAGVNVQLCDAQATPAVASSCVTQAIHAKAAGIIASSMPPAFAGNAFRSAVDAKIPLLFVNNEPSDLPASYGADAVALPLPYTEAAEITDNWIIAASHRKAHVLVVGVTDSEVTTSTYQSAVSYLKSKCSSCSVTTATSSSTQLSQETSTVSAALAANPSINYVFVEYDSFVPGAQQAIAQLGRTAKVKLVSTLGQLDGLERMKAGKQAEDTAFSTHSLGWAEADVMLRMLLRKNPEVAEHVEPLKVLVPSALRGLNISTAGWASGKWVSPTNVAATYEKLWRTAS